MDDTDILALAERKLADLTTSSGTYDPTGPDARAFGEEVARATAMLGPDGPSINAAFDGMVRPMTKRAPYRVVFWSLHPRAGRTTALLNIAHSLGRVDRQVVLVDCNQSSEGVGLSSGLPPGTRGLSDLVLEDSGEHPRCCLALRRFGEMEVALLPIGTRAAELAAGAAQHAGAIHAVFDQFNSADYLLIDSPIGRSPLANVCTHTLAQSIVACLWLGPAGIAETMASGRVEPLSEEEMRTTVLHGEETLEALDLMAADRPAHTHVFVQEARFVASSPHELIRRAIRQDFNERLYEVTQRMSPRLRVGAPPTLPMPNGVKGYLLTSDGRLSQVLRENVADALANMAAWLEVDRQMA